MPRMVELASQAVRGLDRVLEVAAGTEVVTVGLARSAHSLIATDYANATIQLLKRRLEEEGLSHVRCEQADLHRLPLPTQPSMQWSNERPASRAGFRSLASLRRVLKPGGLLIAPTFVHDETLISWTLSRVLAMTGFPGRRRFSARSLEEGCNGPVSPCIAPRRSRGIIPIH